jgi:GrpB-like predicted nucleotidyltransferase (UPF0157 family)
MAQPLVDINLVVADTTDEEDSELYAQAKRELGAQEWKYVQNYADAKTTVVEEILARAVSASS